MQRPPLGVPTPRPTAAPGVMLVMLTFKPPTCWTLNGCELTPCTTSVSLNVSLIVGTTGIGVAGATGSLQPAVRRPRPRTAARIRFIVLRSYPHIVAAPKGGRQLRDRRPEEQTDGQRDSNSQRPPERTNCDGAPGALVIQRLADRHDHRDEHPHGGDRERRHRRAGDDAEDAQHPGRR